VLKKVLGDLPGFDLGDFVRKDMDGELWVTTRRLPEFLEKWLEYEVSREEGRVRRLVHAQQTLLWAKVFVSKYCSVNSCDGNPIWPVEDLVSLSLFVLGETLTWALQKIQKKTKFNLGGWHDDQESQGWGYSKLALEKLENKGLCKKTIAILQGRLRGNTIGLLYAFWTHLDENPRDHQLCTPERCQLSAALPDSQVPPKYKMFHKPRCDRNTCEPIGPNVKKLGEILRSGKIPLLRYKDRELELVEMSPSCNKEYTIFSHVWADGYGNPNDNKINKCVLDLFSELFSDIREQRNRGRYAMGTELFWIDTLAVPVGEEYRSLRDKAIMKMHDIYAHAKYTVVLDAGLMNVNRGEGYVRPAMRITASRWMTRLWTLQEAFLSRNLYFNFSDKVYSMDDLELLFEHENSLLHTCGPAMARTYFHGILGNERQLMRNDPELIHKSLEPSCQLVATVWKALQWRTTEHPQHETLALATLLNINTAPFADSSNTAIGFAADAKSELDKKLDNRMKELLSILAQRNPCAIPSGMIFLPGPRLSEDGYRWAPRSWLSGYTVNSPDPLTFGSKPARLRPPHGLEVDFPGFLLHEFGDLGASPENFKELSFPVDRSLLEWYSLLKADDEENFPNRNELGNKRLAIIAMRLPVIMDKEIALLVAGDRNAGVLYRVKILCRVWLCREFNQQKLEKLRTEFRTDPSGMIPCGEMVRDDYVWCVDGPRVHSEPARPQIPVVESSQHPGQNLSPESLTGFAGLGKSEGKPTNGLKNNSTYLWSLVLGKILPSR
jgi:hypothetical protein